MAYQRIVKYVVTPIMGTFDEDGNLTNETAQPPEPIYFPYGLNLENLTARLEKEAEKRPEGARR